MLVRYRTVAGITINDLKADLDGIIKGTITSASQLSTYAKDNSEIYGTYPSNIYARVNGTSYTYSKKHHTESTYTHYFRLTFDSTKLTTLTLAQGYTSGTDTLLNTSVQTVNHGLYIFDPYYPVGLDIIINDKMIYFNATMSSFQLGVFDMGHNGTSRAYTSSMLMAFQDMSNVIGFKTNTGGTIPYTYNFDSLSYGTIVTSMYVLTPLKRYDAQGKVILTENPVFTYASQSSNVYHLLYGVYKLPINAMAGSKLYKDSSNLYRLTVNDFSLLVD